jgi:hypothetical protein
VNAADLNPGLIVAGVTVCCAAGVALGFTLSPRVKDGVKDGIGWAYVVPFQVLTFFVSAAASYELLVRHRAWGTWGIALWAAMVLLGAVAIIRELIKRFSGDSTAGERRI